MNPRLTVGLSAFLGSFYSLLPPLVALLILPTGQYGIFSAIYLLFAFGVSIQYSLISEAWLRTKNLLKTSPKDYSSAITGLSVVILILGLLFSLLYSNHLSGALIFAFAASISVFRVAARYLILASGKEKRIIFVDSCSIFIFFLFTFLGIILGVDDSLSFGLGWLVSSLIGAVLYLRPEPKFWLFILWVKKRWNTIKPLLVDSIMMDFGAIGVPLYVAFQIPVDKFATYRAVASVAFPVRILLDPVRAKIGQISIEKISKPLYISSIWVSSVVIGACLWVGVAFISEIESQAATVLPTLVPFGLAIAIFGGTSLAGTIYYISARTHCSGKWIILGRVFQTLLVVLLPLVGLSLWGLNGAIYGFAISGGMSSIIWTIIVVASKRK